MDEDRQIVASAVADGVGAAVVSMSALGGGDVAASFRVELDDGRTVFAKTHASAPDGFFTTEASGLSWLRETDSVRVPEVLAVGDDPPHLVLQWIEVGSSGPGADEALGRSLAEMHRAGAPSFGREDRRMTGSRGLPNEPTDDWATFYAESRLLPLARLARDGDVLSETSVRLVERLAASLDGRAPAEPPARLHGDLWGGNRVVDVDGRSWLIDPAAHGGHREFDLAMMHLFGGFATSCFRTYDEVFPLADEWQDRMPLHQLAPLLVHAIKFGGHYVRQCVTVIADLA